MTRNAAINETETLFLAGSRDFENFIYLISHDVRNSVRTLIELPQWIEDDLAEAGVKVDGSDLPPETSLIVM